MSRMDMVGTITVDDTNNQIEVQEEVLGAYQLSLCASLQSFLRVTSSYASVQIINGPYKGKHLGETECIPRDANPDWCKTFFLDFLPGDGTILLVTVWDYNNGSSAYKLGAAKVRPEEVLKRSEIEISLAGNGSNVLACRIEKSMIGDKKEDLAFQIRGLDMANQEPGPFSLGRSDPFYEISKKSPDSESEWNAVYRSKHKYNHLNPMWPKAQLGLPEICFGDLTWPIKISVYDYNRTGRHVLMGEVVTSVEEMQQRIAVRGNADRFQALPITNQERGTISGYICVLKASMVPPGDRKTIHGGRKEDTSKVSAWFCFFLLIFVILLPLIIGLVVAQGDNEARIDKTPKTTFDSYYLDYERDLNVTLRDGILSGYLSSHHALDPQTLALNWLTKEDTGSNLTTSSTADLLQRYAMAVFYFAMDGDNWNQNTTFLSEASVCDWGSTYGDGVTCNGAGQVISFRLFDRGLSGPLPNEISLLFALEGIYLSRNNITRIPARIGSLRNLEHLYLAHNQLSGGFPESMSKLRKLRTLHLQGNPNLIGNLDPLCENVNKAFYGTADCSKGSLICKCCKASKICIEAESASDAPTTTPVAPPTPVIPTKAPTSTPVAAPTNAPTIMPEVSNTTNAPTSTPVVSNSTTT